MKIVHFPEISSTQTYLKDNWEHFHQIEKENQILVTTKKQSAGRGRGQNNWLCVHHSLAFSFTLTPHDILTLSSLEVACLIVDFFQRKFDKNLFIKWPNDLFVEDGHKCGGILIQNVHNNLIVGVGLNLFPSDQDKIPAALKNQIGYIFNINEAFHCFSLTDKSNLPLEIYQYILDHRKNEQEVIRHFENKCLHLKKEVIISDETSRFQGIFLGIGPMGEAQILSTAQNKTKLFFTGSLTIVS